mmetsp:Transcript_9141/g.12976  ORF Transcript_9141/g.12976 Transcript_9141/m.12976 type:complete len:87 (+) Transcript_9141:819-1079(+)
MSWTGYNSEQLRYGPNEIHDLWHKEKKEGFAKVTKYSHYSKCHSRKVAEGVTHKYGRGVPIVLQEAQCNSDKREHDHGAKEMIFFR